MWQQPMQLMQSFHNDMLMMLQMFIAMHREHLGSVRGELDRVQQLTQELTLLNARLDQLSGPAGPQPTSAAGREREDPRRISPLNSTDAEPSPLPSRQIRRKTERRPTGDPDGKSRSSRSLPVDKDPAKSRPAPPPAMGGPETFADLTRRIAEIQRERQGYWQSILKAIAK